MRVSIHQPQYIPWLPYFAKIEESDLFIFLDSVDFQKNGLQNRNQIKTSQGVQWLTVPVRQRLGQKIADVTIDDHSGWRRKHWQTLLHSYGKAPKFEVYESDIQEWFDINWSGLSELNTHIIMTMLRWMDIRTPTRKSSEMMAAGNGSDLILNLCLETGATTYISGVGGKSYLNDDDFKRAGVEILYRAPALPKAYPQLFPAVDFHNDLSAIDLLLNCGDAWRTYALDLEGK